MSAQCIPTHVDIEEKKLANKKAKKYANMKPNIASSELQKLANGEKRFLQQKSLPDWQNKIRKRYRNLKHLPGSRTTVIDKYKNDAKDGSKKNRLDGLLQLYLDMAVFQPIINSSTILKKLIFSLLLG